MNPLSNLVIATRSAAVLLAVLSLGGCACLELCGSCDDGYCGDACYAEWPCFGYRSTCWRPWPGECITCPSPFLPPETVTSPAPMPGDVPMPPLPMPMPATPPAAPNPIPGEEQLGEFSSRRHQLENQYSLGGLRWAPADSP